MNDSTIKRNLKKKVAFLLALSMLSSFSGTTVSAIGNLSGISKNVTGRNSNSSSASEVNSQLESVGKIDISFGSALLIDDIEFDVTLTGDNGFSESRKVTIGNSAEQKTSFDNLAVGKYTVRVSAEGFATYEQDITVENKLYSLRITTGFCGGYSYTQDGRHPGVILIGDVDGNGRIDDEDKNTLIDVIDGKTCPENCTTDLNRDGQTDLLDLTLFSKGYKVDKDTKAAVEEFVSPQTISANVPESTAVMSGSVEEMLCGEKPVTLAPKNNEEISAENPVSVELDIAGNGGSSIVDGITIETGDETYIEDALIDVTYVEDGVENTVKVPLRKDVHYLLKESEVYAEVDADGNIQVHLGEQVAIKRVVLTVTAVQNSSGNNNLAEISKVEFVNGMENRIPEPELDIPEKFTATPASQKIKLSWTPCVNVTGYEVKIESNGVSETVKTTSNSLAVSSFGGKELKNYTEYTVSVQSVNGTWRSGYCSPEKVTPKPEKRPDKPDNVTAKGAYRSVSVSWKNMDDTVSYNVYYKLRNSDDEYTKVSGITANKYNIENLLDVTEYEIYVTGENELGESPASIHCAAETTDLDLADMPRYNLINRDENGKAGSTHIVDVKRYGGEMVDSELDEGLENTAWGAVDGNKSSYYSKAVSYDGGWNALGNNGLTYTFDDEYKLDTIGILTTKDISFTHIRWWDKDGKLHSEWNGSWDYTNFATAKSDAQGRRYYLLKLPNPITATKVQIGIGRWGSPVTVAETYFYHYDTLMDDIMNLYEDSLHTVLKEDVTQETIDVLRERVNAPDEFGEINPDKVTLLRELETAERILNDESLSRSVKIHNSISTNDVGRGFSGLNAWQPLGVSSALGEEITIYVGHNTKKTGDSTDLRLIYTQYHAESNGVELGGANLKVGANTVTLRKGGTSIGAETGGALYIQYQGNNANDQYAVRVSGGAEVPCLDLYKVTDENERLERTVEFVEKLDRYVAEMETLHNELHAGSGNKNVNYSYDNKNCILGASDIMLDTMMLSLPAQQILAGAGGGSSEERAGTILKSMKAMEDMMYLFYQHKGLNASAPAAVNQIPKGHLNIRYQRMFSGAFMYAAGNHIGVEWGSTSGLVNCNPVVSDDDGRYISGRYFGWGIAHEIGHCINQGTYAVAEITNNYFSQLAQAKDTNESMRFKYDKIYSKVTSGTKGNASDVFTQLGMYWQLHLAYDKGLNYKTYSGYNDQLNNIFFARVDTYSRNTASAPAPNGVKLTLNGGTDQNLMRLACAAAEKNVLEFFERWGKQPNEATIAYAEQFEKETRAIYYANDDAHVYSLTGESILGTAGTVKAIDSVSVKTGKAPNQIEMNFRSCAIPESDILGYEVIRCTISGGRVEEVPVGFATGSTFTDTVTTMNNRTVFYKVTLIDKYLNRSEVVTTKQVKIEHDGSMDKTNWSISTTGLTAEAVIDDATDEMPCEKTVSNPAEMVIDHNLSTVYTPRVNNDTAEIIIDFNQTLTASGLKYTVGDGQSVGEYKIYVCENDNWILTAEGEFRGSETVYFANDDDKYISTYAATAVKFVILNQKNAEVSISEIDILGVTGDNVDFRRTAGDKTNVIGTLGKDYKYGDNPKDVIPEGSLIFTGAYKGNPAYSTVILYDGNGNIVGGLDAENNITAQQIILADVPDGKDITNVSDGTWVYWIEPEQMSGMNMPEIVRAELYRVNNALTNEGQRLVSDTLYETLPDELPTIIFNAD